MVKPYTPERVAEICHIDARDLVSAAKLYGSAERAAIMYCLGVAEHSTAPKASCRCPTSRSSTASSDVAAAV